MTRMRALVQAKRRKIHLASISAGDTVWVSFCDQDIPAAPTTTWWIHDADTIAHDRIDQICTHCYRMLLLEQLILTEHGINHTRRTA